MTSPTCPLVSVIVPVYNVERYLDCCLDSIRAQTYDRLEIIVVEDCSTDGSLAKLQPHLSDPRVRLIQHERNSGLSAARNTGIEAASGDYVMFVDSDDMIAPKLVEVCVAQAVETKADVLVYDFVSFQDGEPLPKLNEHTCEVKAQELISVEYFKLPHFAWLKFIRRELLDNPRLRFPIGLYYEDWPFHWELGFVAKSIGTLDIPRYCYRQRKTSITGSVGSQLLDLFRVQEMVLNTVRKSGSGAEASAFSTKVHAGFWSVLTRIDPNLLPKAIVSAKRLRHSVRSVVRIPPQGSRGKVMAALLSLPYPLSYRFMRLLRLIKSGPKSLGAGTSDRRAMV